LVIQKKFEAKQFIEWIYKYNINNIMAAPAMLSLLLKESALLEATDLSKVTHIGFASAPVSKKLFQAIKEKFTQAYITNNYGSSEAGPGLFNRSTDIKTPELSVGYPYPHISYRLNQGVLEIKNPYMMLGYDNHETTNITADGYFITNDIFEIDQQGFYYFIGRADDMFTSGGNNIYPRQIELVLENHPAVVIAAVVGVEDDVKGHKPYAFVVTNSTVLEDELKEFILESLPVSHCPRKIWNIDAMPINPATNKVNKLLLKEKAKENLL
jgi:acyl-coenzyme A synthetase/AMP-(fatty) acid ligase